MECTLLKSITSWVMLKYYVFSFCKYVLACWSYINYKCTQRKSICVICPNAIKKHAVLENSCQLVIPQCICVITSISTADVGGFIGVHVRVHPNSVFFTVVSSENCGQ